MKQITLIASLLLTSAMSFSQKDSTKSLTDQDTVKVGNFIIIKNKVADTIIIDGKKTVNIKWTNKTSTKEAKSNISTNWGIIDLGFANYRDQTDYSITGLARTSDYIQKLGPNNAPDGNTNSLYTAKSSNFNIWLFMQKVSLAHHRLNIKYGVGLEMYNFRYDRNLSYRKDPMPYMFTDSIGFSKNKLFAEYLTVPFMFNYSPFPDKKKGFSISAGVSAGYLVASRNKQISDQRGKIKYRGDFGLDPWRFAVIGELGLGQVRLYGSYSLNALHKSSTGMQQYPYAVGIRFSNW